MKKSIFIILFALIGYFNTNAQVNAIKTGPIALAFGDINFGFEHQFSEKVSLTLGLDYYTGFKIDDSRIDAFGFGGGIRYYMVPAGDLAGFYVNPRLNYNSAGLLGLGATIGYQWHWDNNLVLDAGVGPSKLFAVGDYSGTVPGIWPMVTLAVGYAF
jgi:hypothetical protein